MPNFVCFKQRVRINSFITAEVFTFSSSYMSTNIVLFYANLMQLLQPLRWCCVECVIHHERDVREEQHICGANKQ